MKTMTTSMRKRLDRVFQSLIRLAMATGVCFTVTACYGVPPEYKDGWYEPYPNDTTQVADSVPDMRRAKSIEQQDKIERMAQQLKENKAENKD